MQAKIEGPVIKRGYEYRGQLEIVTSPGLFPSGAVLLAHIKAQKADATPIGVLSTGNGGLVRVSDTVIDILISPAITAACLQDSVVIDFIRTDVSPPRHLQFTMTVPVDQPVTRPPA